MNENNSILVTNTKAKPYESYRLKPSTFYTVASTQITGIVIINKHTLSNCHPAQSLT